MSRAMQRSLWVFVVTFGLLFALGSTPVLAAGTMRYVSPTGADSGNCSNPAAPCRTIAYALNMATAGDTINLAAGTYTTNGEISIVKSITLAGAGAANTIVQAAASYGSGVDRVFYDMTNDPVTIQDMTIRYGNVTTGNGGAITASGPLTLTNVLMTDNRARKCGGVEASGALTIISSTISNNTSTNTDGGGLCITATTANIISSTITNNTAPWNGGGVLLTGGTLTLTNSLISENSVTSSSGYGAGIMNYNASGRVRIFGSSILSNTNLAGTSGGAGIVNNGGILEVSNSAVNYNRSNAPGGGIRNSVGTMLITNTTLAYNNTFANGFVTPGNRGSAIYNQGGVVTLTYGTVAGNIGSGSLVNNTGSLFWQGTIVTSTGYGGNCSGLTSGAGNLSSDNTCGLATGNNVNPQLGTLTGSPSYFLITAASPAFDSIAPGVAECGTGVKTDQRGAGRPNGLPAACDAGAYEMTYIRYIDPAGSDTNTCSTPAQACATLQYVHDQATSGSTIFAGAGTYTESGVILSKNLTILGSGPGSTIMQGAATPGAATQGILTINAVANVTLQGFTLRYGNAPSAGGAISNSGSLTLKATTIISNNAASSGGGIANLGTIDATGVALGWNSAGVSGGAVDNSGQFALNSSTVFSNTAPASPGLRNTGAGSLGVGFSTLYGAGGGVNHTGLSFTMQGNILYNTTCTSSFADLGYNLDTGTGCGLTAPTSLSNTDPQLGAFTAPIYYFPITSASPAFNRVPSGLLGCGTTLKTDQRGEGRPNGPSCDSGAYEFTYVRYVGSGGNDTGTCSNSASPCATPTYAIGQASAGNTISLLVGSIIEPSTIITKDLTIQGVGTGVTMLRTALSVTLGTRVTLRDLSMCCTSAMVRNSGSLTITTAELTSGGGTALMNYGTLTVTNSTIHDNSNGGLINASLASLTGSSVYSNTNTTAGGGLSNSGQLYLTGSSVYANASSAAGGGLSNSGQLYLTGSSVYANTSAAVGGGLSNSGQLHLTQSSVYSNTSGGLGGGLSNTGTTLITNTTLAGNTSTEATTGGGGLYNSNVLTVTASTIAYNEAPNTFLGTGGNLYTLVGARTKLQNTLVSDSLTGNCTGAKPTDSGYNLSDDTSCAFTATGSITNGFANLGGYTGTPAYVPLKDGSDAIDAIPANASSCGTTLTADQRGVLRPFGLGCDIGAYELAIINQTVTPTLNVPYHGLVTYTIVLANYTSQADTTATLNDLLPTSITFTQWIARPAGANIVNNGNGTFSLVWAGTINPSQLITFTFQATHTGNFNETVVNTADYSGKQAIARSSQAVFVTEPLPQLTVIKAGNPQGGTVTGTPAWPIDCGATCVVSGNPHIPVTLTATTYPTATFYGWTGGGCSGTGITCTLPMHAATTVTTTFRVKTALAITSITPTLALVGQPVRVYYSANAGGTLLPTGNVVVTLSDGVTQCTALVTASSCVFTPSRAGTYTVTATYAGNTAFDGSTATTAYTINPAATTTTLGTFPPAPYVIGQAINLDYAVAVVAPGAGTPTGTLTITDEVGTVYHPALPNGTLTFTPTVSGLKTFTATYAGSPNFLASSSLLTATINKADVLVAITYDAPDPSLLSQAIVVSFTVTAKPPASGTPTGMVRVGLRNDTAYCLVPVSAHGCTLQPTRRQNTILVASYRGDDYFNPGEGATPHWVGNPAARTTAIVLNTAQPAPSIAGQAVLVSYTVTSAPYTPTLPGEVVIISSGGEYCVGGLAQSTGTGACQVVLNNAGTYTLTGLYSGDDYFNGATATRLQTVLKAQTRTRVMSSVPEPSVVSTPYQVYFNVDTLAPGQRYSLWHSRSD